MSGGRDLTIPRASILTWELGLHRVPLCVEGHTLRTQNLFFVYDTRFLYLHKSRCWVLKVEAVQSRLLKK